MEQIFPVIISSIIAFLGVIISIVETSRRSNKEINTEIQKLRSEIQQDYANKLLDKRLETYPRLYFLLSDFAKAIRFGRFKQDTVKKLITEIERGIWKMLCLQVLKQAE